MRLRRRTALEAADYWFGLERAEPTEDAVCLGSYYYYNACPLNGFTMYYAADSRILFMDSSSRPISACLEWLNERIVFSFLCVFTSGIRARDSLGRGGIAMDI